MGRTTELLNLSKLLVDVYSGASTFTLDAASGRICAALTSTVISTTSSHLQSDPARV